MSFIVTHLKSPEFVETSRISSLCVTIDFFQEFSLPEIGFFAENSHVKTLCSWRRIT